MASRRHAASSACAGGRWAIRAVRFFGHVYRLPDTRLARKVLTYSLSVPASPKGSAARQSRWLTNVRELIIEYKINMRVVRSEVDWNKHVRDSVWSIEQDRWAERCKSASRLQLYASHRSIAIDCTVDVLPARTRLALHSLRLNFHDLQQELWRRQRSPHRACPLCLWHTETVAHTMCLCSHAEMKAQRNAAWEALQAQMTPLGLDRTLEKWSSPGTASSHASCCWTSWLTSRRTFRLWPPSPCTFSPLAFRIPK